MKPAVDPDRDALVVVDVQQDFCPGGALPVPDGDAVVEPVNRLLALPWTRVATRDWHPARHCSFLEQGGIWPPHCVAGTAGAAFHPRLRADRVARVVSKGTDPAEEAYSGFQGTDLAEWLRGRGIHRVFVCGLATDYCVRATALDALREGFQAVLVTDAMRGVEVKRGDCARALADAEGAGAQRATSEQLCGGRKGP
jgi:nicotinamidase/pyrazinamidase